MGQPVNIWKFLEVNDENAQGSWNIVMIVLVVLNNLDGRASSTAFLSVGLRKLDESQIQYELDVGVWRERRNDRLTLAYHALGGWGEGEASSTQNTKGDACLFFSVRAAVSELKTVRRVDRSP